MINLSKLEAVIASYLRGNQLPCDRQTVSHLSRAVVNQAEMLIHSLIRQEIERTKNLA